MGLFDDAEKLAGEHPDEVKNLTQDAEKFADQETGNKFDSEISDAGTAMDNQFDQQPQDQQQQQ